MNAEHPSEKHYLGKEIVVESTKLAAGVASLARSGKLLGNESCPNLVSSWRPR